MKFNKISLILAAGLSVSALSGCGIYTKYNPEKVNNALVNEYAEALKQEADPEAFGNLKWQQVFTDPMLADLIERPRQQQGPQQRQTQCRHGACPAQRCAP